MQEELGSDQIIWDADGTKKLQCMHHEELVKHMNAARDKQIEAGSYHDCSRRKGAGEILREAGIIPTFTPEPSGSALTDKLLKICKEAELRAKRQAKVAYLKELEKRES